jgi:hypothetical protein
MLIHWCLKGIAESSRFRDSTALRTLSAGIHSMWMVSNVGAPLTDVGVEGAQDALNDSALDDHVNNFGAVAHNTPYISLSAGSVVPNSSSSGVLVWPAWRTALDFATRGGQSSGYVFRCWTIVSPKPSASIPNISDEVRELNLFRQFWPYHDEGEIAAKLLVPSSQIEWYRKFDNQLRTIDFHLNPRFVDPNEISNIIEAVT